MKLEEAKKLKNGDIVYSTNRKEPRSGNVVTESLSKEEFEKQEPLRFEVMSEGYRNPLLIPLISRCGYSCITKERLGDFSLTK